MYAYVQLNHFAVHLKHHIVNQPYSDKKKKITFSKAAFEQWALDFTPGRKPWQEWLDWENYDKSQKTRGTQRYRGAVCVGAQKPGSDDRRLV